MVNRTKLRSFAQVYLSCGGNLHQGVCVHEKARTIPLATSPDQSVHFHLPLLFYCLFPLACLTFKVACHTELIAQQNRRTWSERLPCMLCRL